MKQTQRIFIPGSEWLYIKIYGGEKTLDKIIGNEINTIIKKIHQKYLIHKWFFIRYADPDSHLRIRFLLKDPSYIQDIIELFYTKLNPLIQDGTVWKIQLDTYIRELERYGNQLIEEAESFFYQDSKCMIKCIKILNGFPDDNYRWMISLKMIDLLLSDFSYTTRMKVEIMELISTSFKNEFGFNEFNAKQFNSKFREHKSIIEKVLENKIEEKTFKQLCLFTEQRSRSMKQISENIYTKMNDKDFPVNTLLSSYIHMTLNRLFRSKNRIHELIIYDFMKRYYISEEAKQKYKKQQRINFHS